VTITNGDTAEPTPEPIGTEAEQTVHREPAPTPAQHNAAVQAARAAR